MYKLKFTFYIYRLKNFISNYFTTIIKFRINVFLILLIINGEINGYNVLKKYIYSYYSPWLIEFVMYGKYFS